MTSVSLTTRTPAELPVDCLVIGSVRTPDGTDLATGHALPRKAVVHLQAVLADLEATGKADEVVRVVAVPGVKATSVVVTGLGEGTSRRATYPHTVLRSAAGAALRTVRGKRTVAVALPTPDVESLSASPTGRMPGATSTTRAHPSRWSARPAARCPPAPASRPRPPGQRHPARGCSSCPVPGRGVPPRMP
jgi:leucyl aminopeptidase